MLYSMTGYGKAENKNNFFRIITEIKCLNSKGIEINLKYPNWLKSIELDIRNLILEKLVRGKIDVFVTIELNDISSLKQYNSEAIKSYYLQLKQLCQYLNVEDNNPYIQATLFRESINIIDAYITNEDELLNEENKHLIFQNIANACENANKYRQAEGDKLEKDILGQIKILDELKEKVRLIEPLRKDKYKEKILNSLKENFDLTKIDNERFEQEMIYYLEKLDINEELVRLSAHINYFIDTCKDGYNIGKKLSFIAQEMGREINTIGSKANDENIQKLVVEMKDVLEKIKEQINNIL